MRLKIKHTYTHACSAGGLRGMDGMPLMAAMGQMGPDLVYQEAAKMDAMLKKCVYMYIHTYIHT
jgi:hypothetical protein